MTDRHTVAVEGSEVELLDVGEGPAVLLLHGSGPGTTGSGAWAATASSLAASRRCVAPDQAGFGGTPRPPGSRGGLSVWARQAAGLMDALDIDTYAVVGHSMGGAVALALAAARPERVTAVVAVASMGAPGAPLSPELDALWGATPDPGGARDVLTRLVRDQSLVTEQAVAARTAAMRARAADHAAMFPPPRDRWVADLTLDEETLSGIRAPVLLVHGAEDRVTPLDTAALPLLAALPRADLHVLGRCGHAVPLERPHAFHRLLEGFLRGELGP